MLRRTACDNDGRAARIAKRARTLLKKELKDENLEEWIAQAKEPSLKMHVRGAGGVGKSVVLHACRSFVTAWGHEHRTCAMTGKAALAVGGSTVHSTFCIAFKGDNKIEQLHMQVPLGESLHERLQEKLGGVKYVFIDEVSMVSAPMLCLISRRMEAANDTFTGGDNSALLGNATFVTFGDFGQFKPLMASAAPLYAKMRNIVNKLITRSPRKQKHSKSKSVRQPLYADHAANHQGVLIWKAFDTVIHLTKSFRQSNDKRYVAFLDRVRKGKCTRSDLHYINQRLLSMLVEQKKLPKQWPFDGSGAAASATAVTSRHLLRDPLNLRMAKAHAQELGARPLMVLARDERVAPPAPKNRNPDVAMNADDDDDDDEEEARTIMGAAGRLKQIRRLTASERRDATFMPSGNTKGIPGRLIIFVGARVTVTGPANINSCSSLGLANGATGTVRKILLHPNEPKVPTGCGPLHVLRFLPSAVEVELDNGTDVLHKYNKEKKRLRGCVPIVPHTTRFDFEYEDTQRMKNRMYVRRLGLYLDMAYAMTDIKVQGQTISRLLADIRKPTGARGGSLQSASPYVVLSRATCLKAVVLLAEVTMEDLNRAANDPERLEAEKKLDNATLATQNKHKGLFKIAIEHCDKTPGDDNIMITNHNKRRARGNYEHLCWRKELYHSRSI
jgi:hypothetical protein